MTGGVEFPARSWDNTGDVVELFAGPGGWSVGAAAVGLYAIGVEKDPTACATAQLAGHDRILADVRTLSTSGFTNVAGVIGSPPCPPFSVSGLHAGRSVREELVRAVDSVAFGASVRTAQEAVDRVCTHPDASLVLEPLRWIKDLSPQWVALEQVPTVLPVWQAYASALSLWGYSVACGWVRAETFGVPQVRRRAVLLASRVKDVALPAGRFQQYVPGEKAVSTEDPAYPLPWVGQALALGWDPADLVGFARRADERARVTIAGTDYRARDLRQAEFPAFTLTEKARSWTRFPAGQPGQGVRVELEEASLLQGFSPDYPWQGSRTAQFHQVGNAVPPPMAAELLTAVAAPAPTLEVTR